MIWRYLQRNIAWLGHALQVPPFLSPSGPSQLTSPVMSFSDPPNIYNPLLYSNRILFTPLNHVSILFINFRVCTGQLGIFLRPVFFGR